VSFMRRVLRFRFGERGVLLPTMGTFRHRVRRRPEGFLGTCDESEL